MLWVQGKMGLCWNQGHNHSRGFRGAVAQSFTPQRRSLKPRRAVNCQRSHSRLAELVPERGCRWYPHTWGIHPDVSKCPHETWPQQRTTCRSFCRSFTLPDSAQYILPLPSLPDPFSATYNSHQRPPLRAGNAYSVPLVTFFCAPSPSWAYFWLQQPAPTQQSSLALGLTRTSLVPCIWRPDTSGSSHPTGQSLTYDSLWSMTVISGWENTEG